MNAEIKQQWIDALRSGQYKQAQGTLMLDGCFCVLGVLCDLYSKDTGEPWETWTTENHTYGTMHDISGGLAYQVLKWAGMNHRPYIDMPDGSKQVISMLNDGGSTFEELAVMIEERMVA